MSTSNSTRNSSAVKLTELRFDILRICATEDGHGRQGFPAWTLKHLKPSSKRTLNWLISNKLVTINVYGNAVTTADGDALYDAHKAESEVSRD